FFFSYSYSTLLYLHSFPTRRSSDLFSKSLPLTEAILLQIACRLTVDNNTGNLQLDKYLHLLTLNVTFLKLGDLSLKNNEDLDHIDRKSTRLNSSHVSISYAVFCLKK